MQPRNADADDSDRLLAQAVAGDRGAVGELLYRQTDGLRAFISRRLPEVLGPAVEVDDVLQDTFALAFREIGRFQGNEGSFGAWLRAIAANRVVDVIRAETRKKRGGGRRAGEIRPNASDTMLGLYDALAGTDSTPLRKASRAEALRLMHVALADLPADYRDAIRLRFLEGHTNEQIAEILNRTPDAVRGLVKRAKERLKEALGRASSYLSSR